MNISFFSGIIYHACTSTQQYNSAQEKCKLPSFTDSKNMIGGPNYLNGSHDFDHVH